MNERTNKKAQITIEKLRAFLQSYKTTPCSEPNCKFLDSNIAEHLFSDIRECKHFHGSLDQRRPPFSSAGAQKLTYSRYMAQVDKGGCLNDIEYMYHPLNFMRTECHHHRPNRKSFCELEHCPFYHQASDKSLVRKLLSSFEQEDVFSRIKENLKINFPNK